jgi:starch synthase
VAEIRVWLAAAEAAPFAQTGGMGDVLRALPAALARAGAQVELLLPAYGRIDRSGFEHEDTNLAVPLGPARVPVRFLRRRAAEGASVVLVDCEELFAREGLYGPPGGEYPDNARRFALFSRAVTERARRASTPPDLLHLHDWHAALVPLFVRYAGGWSRPPRTLLTIHNLAYQGRFGGAEADWMSLRPGAEAEVLRSDGLEDHGGINFLKAGIAWADRLSTVSPGHAREILTSEHGWGLEATLRRRVGDLSGILNGADYSVWDPAADPHLPRPYGARSPRGESLEKGTAEARVEAGRVVRERLGLPASTRPLLGVVGRLVQQKGIDILLRAAPALLDAGADLVVLGAGEPDLERGLSELRTSRPDRIGLRLGYDEPLSHLVLAGSDLLLVPSRYEPCGLVQMYALRYGTPPVVHRTGGLADTVRDIRDDPSEGTGFVFSDLSAESLAGAVRRALDLRASDPKRWRRLQARGMAEDFSWDRAASAYLDLYRRMIR